MYKTKTLLLVCSLLALMASCDSEPERHELSPVEQSIIIYADQTLDSLRFYTYDNWTATSQTDWISFVGKSREDNITNDYMKRFLCRVIVSVKPNTTGRTRYGSVLVQSYDYSYSSPIVQLGMLDVSHPVVSVDSWLDEQSRIPDVAHFELVDSALWTSDYISFTVQNNWDLVFVGEAPDWLTLDRQSDLPGKHQVNLTLKVNPEANERRATLRLISGEVSNDIIVRQLPIVEQETGEE